MNEQSDNSGQLPQAEAGSGADALDARTVYALATSWRRQASSQKSGRSTLIRCAEELEASLAARQPAGQARVEELRDALGKVRLRCMFIGWPAESMWEATPGNWIPDWRYELQLMEHVLHGSEIRTPEKPTDTVPRNQLPRLVANEPVAKVRQDGGNGPVVWYYPHTFYGTKIPDGSDLFLGPPAPAAVPVDVLRDAAELLRVIEANGEWEDGCFYYHHRSASELQAPLIALRKTLADHSQPAAASVPDLFVQWLEREMPAGTIIGKPAWWAPKLARALRSAERGVLGGCNG